MATNDNEPNLVKLPDEMDILRVIASGLGAHYWLEHSWKLYLGTLEDAMTGRWYLKWLEALREHGIIPGVTPDNTENTTSKDGIEG